ncbi:hypothetical protein [Fodinicurvata fenggangensis]|uniref:hypothetical protein n=1 Tax=Fodinicurvata fenggangensis TaxID=1121830 RepID=UPI000479BF49|nr:hypothetical protein [Fodinicurvata fenggangensis]
MEDEFDFLPDDFPSHHELVRYLAQRLGRLPTLAEVAALRGVMIEKGMRRKARKDRDYQGLVAGRKRLRDEFGMKQYQKKPPSGGEITHMIDNILGDMVLATVWGMALWHALRDLHPILARDHADPDDDRVPPEDWAEDGQATEPHAIVTLGKRLREYRLTDNPQLTKGFMMPTGSRWRAALAYIEWKAGGGLGAPPPAAVKGGHSQLIIALANRTSGDGLRRMLTKARKAEQAGSDMQRKELLDHWECLGAVAATHPRHVHIAPGPGTGELDLPPAEPEPEPEPDSDSPDDTLDSTRLGLPQPPSPPKSQTYGDL